MIADSLKNYLSANAAIAALCPESIFPQVMPLEAKLPAITYSLDGDTRDQLLDVVGALRQALVSIDVFDPDHYVAHQLADTVEGSLVDYRGAFGSKTAEHIRLERRFDLFESDSKLYRVSQQFLIAYY
jgi:hypothetical protein